MSKKIVAGNWKMNLDKNGVIELVSGLNNINIPDDVDVFIFPSQAMVGSCSDHISDGIGVGAQNFSQFQSGAYTGESSIDQIQSLGANIALIGHSERRGLFAEDEEMLRMKVDAALEMNLDFIFCCGEPLDVRQAGKELDYVKSQLAESLFHLTAEQMSNRIIAYEPIWAIGTGLTASSEEAELMHKEMRAWIIEKYGDSVAQSVTILYGGSCNASNARELFAQPNVDGGLIGGASLKADAFVTIINSFG